mmetsp:Transcript_129341/g.374560  ORF Transcript_129341/g.374560 Transcript_129341/m.374560 type:complete len:511 (-) Transcript_129341:225-1757(-)
MPCDLWTLTAHARSRGNCILEPSMSGPQRASNVSRETAISRPSPFSPAVSKDTRGKRKDPAPSKPTTTPWEPLTSRRRKLIVRVRITSAPTFSSKTRRAPVCRSKSSELPMSTDVNIMDSVCSIVSERALTDSTSDRNGINLVTARFPRPSYATKRSRNNRSESPDNSPNRTWFRISVKLSSPLCLNTSVNSKVLVTALHALTSKQNLASRPFGTTGGSCMKSPVNTIWMPPNGLFDPLTARARRSSLPKSSPSSIDISSMINVLVHRHRCTASRFDINSRAKAAALPSPLPIAAHLCSVTPPNWLAASAVDAVMAVPMGSNIWINCRRRKDLPVPAPPVKKMLWPCNAASQTCRCSSVSSKVASGESLPKPLGAGLLSFSAFALATALLSSLMYEASVAEDSPARKLAANMLRRRRLEATPSSCLYLSTPARFCLPSVAARISSKNRQTSFDEPLKSSWPFRAGNRTPRKPFVTWLWCSVAPPSGNSCTSLRLARTFREQLLTLTLHSA